MGNRSSKPRFTHQPNNALFFFPPPRPSTKKVFTNSPSGSKGALSVREFPFSPSPPFQVVSSGSMMAAFFLPCLSGKIFPLPLFSRPSRNDWFFPNPLETRPAPFFPSSQQGVEGHVRAGAARPLIPPPTGNPPFFPPRPPDIFTSPLTSFREFDKRVKISCLPPADLAGPAEPFFSFPPFFGKKI